MTITRGFFLSGVFLSVFGVLAVAHGAAGITYTGRLLKQDGTPVLSSAVVFKLQIRTPGNENCLLYEEQQTKNLSASNGMFAITIGDNTATVVNTEPFNLSRAFQNRGTFTFGAGKCVSGNDYTPNFSDNRNLVVEFNDGSFAGWEAIPVQPINRVPFAIESMAVGGYHAGSLVRVVDGAGDPLAVPALSQADHSTLLDLLHGSSALYRGGSAPVPGASVSGSIAGNAAGFTGSLVGDVTGGQSATVVAGIQGREVDAAAPSDGQALVWSNVNNRWVPGTVAGGASDWSTLTGKPSTFAPTAHSHAVSDITSAAGDYFVYRPDGTACAADEVLKWDAGGGGRWVCGADASGGAPSGAAGGELSGNYPNPTVAAATAATNNSLVRRDGSGGIAGTAANFTSLVLSNGTSTVTLSAPASFTTYATKLPSGAGTAGQILTSNGTDMVWANASSITASNVSGTVAVANGGTGATTASAARTNLGATVTGSSLFTAADAAAARTAISAMANVAPGTSGNVLTSNGTAWTSAPFTVNANNVGSASGVYFTYRPNNGACANGEVLKWEIAGGGRWACGTDISSTGGTGVGSVSATAPVTVDNTDPNNPRVEIDDATTTTTGVVQLATSSDTTAGLVVQANDSRLTDGRAPTGSAGGDLTGTYPNPTIAKLQTKDLTLASLASGDVLRYDGTKWVNAQPSDTDTLGGMSCSGGDVALYNGSTWTCVNASVTSSNNSLVRRDGSGVIASAGGNFGSLMVNNGGGSTITVQSPVAFTSYTLKLPSGTGSNGQYLTSNGTDMVWTSPSFMASVATGASGNVLTSNGTSWTSTALPTATTGARGLMQVGTGLAVSGGTVSVDFGTTAGKVAEGNDSRFPSSTCASGNASRWDGTAWQCEASSGAAFPLLGSAGSAGAPTYSFSGSGENDNGMYRAASNTLAFSTAGGERLRISSTGNIGIGTTSTDARVQVAGAIVTMPVTYTSSFSCGTSAINFSTSNFQRLSPSNTITGGNCNVALQNMVAGGSYTLIMTGNAAVNAITYIFTGYTFKYLPGNAATTAAKDTVYTFLYDGTTVYVTWSSGY